MRFSPIAAALGMLCGSALYSQELPQWVLQLSRVKRQAKAEQVRIPNFACRQTVSRFQSAPHSPYKPLDTIRMDVAFLDGKELVAPAGSKGEFQEMNFRKVSGGGVMGTGAFSSIARNLFVSDNGRVTGWAEERLLDRPALRFDYVVPELFAGLILSSPSGSESVAISGSFWADAETFDLLRIDQEAVDIPPSLNIQQAYSSVTYSKVRIGSSDIRLPVSAETEIVNVSGWRGRNTIEFSGCREYVADSVIHFDSVDPTSPPIKKP